MTAMNETISSEEQTTSERVAALQDAAVTLVTGTMVNASGLVLSKVVPVERTATFHRSGMGTAPVWDVFTIDGGIAFTDAISAVGDRRLRIDLDALRVFRDGWAWAPTNVHLQDGTPASTCTRSALTRIQDDLRREGLEALVGHEVEFVLVAPDGSELDGAWTPYGLTGVFERSAFLEDLVRSLADGGVFVEQIHSEYGRNQFEFSIPPASPVEAADRLILARIILGLVARRHDVAVSVSPAPFPGSVGNGAHQHFSLTRDGMPLFAGGDRVRGFSDEGAAAVAGIVRALPHIQGFLTGSVLSGLRLGPGTWSGAFACWGHENREAAVRYLSGGPSNPRGSHIEVKTIDPSANVYLASAAVLAAALDGIRTQARVPDEITVDPSTLSDAERAKRGVVTLPSDPADIIDALDRSTLARRLLGDDIVDVTVAVRRYEQEKLGADVDPADLAERFRLAWSV